MRIAIALLLFLTGCAQNPITRYWTPTDEQWQDAAKRGTSATLSTGQRHSIYASHARNLYETWQAIIKQSGPIATLGVAESDTVNAFATFDKTGRPLVILTFPLLTEIGNDPDALAAVLGHEIAHISYGHGLDRKAREEKAGIARTVIGNVLSLAGVPMSGTIANVGVGAVTSAYSRDEEREADLKGIQWAKSAGFDPCGGARLMRVLQKGSGPSIPFLSTHPGHEERIERASNMAGKQC